MKKTKTEGNGAAEPSNTAASQAGAGQDTGINWGEYQGNTGFEGTSDQDFGIPWLTILQKGSPEVDPGHKDHLTKRIEGCKTGDIINSMTREILYSFGPNAEPVRFIPCYHDRCYVEWKPRGSGGGIVKTHRNSAILNEITGKDEKGHDILRNGNVLMETAYFFGLLCVSGEKPQQCVMGLSSTQLKNARIWLNLMSGIKVQRAGSEKFTPPMFSHYYGLTTKGEMNVKGNWMGWGIQNLGPVNDRKLVAQASQVTKDAIQITQPNRPLIAAAASDEDVPM